MKLSKTITTAAIATLMATSSFAQDIAVIAGSIEDAFMDKIKKGVDDATHMVEANGGTVQYLRTQNYENTSLISHRRNHSKKPFPNIEILGLGAYD